MEKEKKKLGIVGCGAIGTEIVRAIDNGDIDVTLLGCFDLEKEQFDALASKLKNLKSMKLYESIEALVKESDLVVECAAQAAVKEVFTQVIKYKKDVMFLSVGGVLRNLPLFEEAKKQKIDVFIPSGAVIGIDGLEAAMHKGIQKVTLISTKPPKGFMGVKYLEDKGIDPMAIKTATVLFDGKAIDAVDKFPANINVAATLSLAGIGAQNTSVKIVADPAVTLNTHEIIVEGDFGRFRVITENKPSPTNPKTSYLTSLSTITMIKKIVGSVHIGT